MFGADTTIGGSRRATASVSLPYLSPSLNLQDSTYDPSVTYKGSPTRKSPRKRKLVVDRFIPNRQASCLDAQNWSRPTSGYAENSSCPSLAQPCNAQRSASLAEACGVNKARILEFQPAAPQSLSQGDLRSHYTRPKASIISTPRRAISSVPERILDAPGIVDDYYLNLLDWSSNNEIAIALDRAVYVWEAGSGNVELLTETSESSYVSSLKWSEDGYLSVGTSDGDVQIWDAQAQTKLRSMLGRTSRVSSLSWTQSTLSSGARDGSIWHHDVRIARHNIAQLYGHTSEVCGLSWRADGLQLASGGNDNIVNIWDARSAVPKFVKTHHQAAVKAIAWCPWQRNLLATGGGTHDRHIHFWNTATGTRVNSVDTESQVTSIHWSPHQKELASCHGFPSNNLTVWSYPSLQKVAEFEAHECRILNGALSPDGQVLATCAADENLKFWRIFEAQGRKLSAASSLGHQKVSSMMIR